MNFLSKLSDLKSDFTLILGYLDPALNNPALVHDQILLNILLSSEWLSLVENFRPKEWNLINYCKKMTKNSPLAWASGVRELGSLFNGCVRDTTSLNNLFTTCWGGWVADISTSRICQFFTGWITPEGSLIWAKCKKHQVIHDYH